MKAKEVEQDGNKYRLIFSADWEKEVLMRVVRSVFAHGLFPGERCCLMTVEGKEAALRNTCDIHGRRANDKLEPNQNV